MVVKSKTMAGFRAPYVPGWDCHGLPIETQVEKELGGKKGSVAPVEFRRICREFALRYVDQHRRDFKRLGVLGRWEDPYLTMSNSYEACIADAFLSFLEKGYVYRGLEAGLLVPSRQDRAGRSRGGIRRPHQPLNLGAVPRVGVSASAADISKMDSTPWFGRPRPGRLPASMALAFHPQFKYVFADGRAGRHLLLAQDLLEQRLQGDGPALHVRIRARSQADFAGAKFQHPFLDRVVPGGTRGARHARAGQRDRAHRSGPRRRGFRGGSGIWPGDLRAAR